MITTYLPLDYLVSDFHTSLKPQCIQFLASPPLNAAARTSECDRLTGTITNRILNRLPSHDENGTETLEEAARLMIECLERVLEVRNYPTTHHRSPSRASTASCAGLMTPPTPGSSRASSPGTSSSNGGSPNASPQLGLAKDLDVNAMALGGFLEATVRHSSETKAKLRQRRRRRAARMAAMCY